MVSTEDEVSSSADSNQGIHPVMHEAVTVVPHSCVDTGWSSISAGPEALRLKVQESPPRIPYLRLECSLPRLKTKTQLQRL